MLISKILVLSTGLLQIVCNMGIDGYERSDLENPTARILLEEARNFEQEEKENAVMFKVNISANIKKRCFKCNAIGHLARSCKMTTANGFKRKANIL